VTSLLAWSYASGQVSPGPLARAHAALEGNANCMKCHAPSKGAGMDARCLACHDAIRTLRDAGRGYHARDGKDDCARCHPDHAGVDFALVDWPSDGPKGLDHARSTGFALSDSHGKLACRDCHQARLQKGRFAPASWLGLDPTCVACHRDPHAGALGAACAGCHLATTWKDVSAFDHARTAFPLDGKHAAVRCASCHDRAATGKNVLKPLPHASCASCHTDPHAGRLGPACAACHTTAGFATVTKGAFDHERTRYPLRGAHRAAACAACHVPGRADRARPAFASCAGCHADPHAGKATLAGSRVDCAACHDTISFKASTFTPARHAATAYPLEGKHAAAPCAACHRPKGPADPALGRAGVVMRPPHGTCAACHADPHGGQFAARTDHGDCGACHATSGFKPSRYGAAEHGRMRVTLDAAHGKIPCAACHGVARKGLPPPPGAAKAGAAKQVFAGIETDCASCHRDPHGFPERDCARCHTQEAFTPSTIGPTEHARLAFPLEGAHAAVPCVLCHRELAPRTPAPTLLRASGPALPLRDPRRACADCHTGPHGAQFATRADGGRCEACHDAAAFRPARRFDHDRDAAFSLGRAHAPLACARCHLARPDASGAPVVVYRGIDPRCVSCHTPKKPPDGGRP